MAQDIDERFAQLKRNLLEHSGVLETLLEDYDGLSNSVQTLTQRVDAIAEAIVAIANGHKLSPDQLRRLFQG